MTALDTLAEEPRWVAWRNEYRSAARPTDKPTKVPYAPSGRARARADAPGTWGTRAAAEERASRIINGQGGGIGIQLGDIGADTYLGGIDLDSCLGGGICANWARDICEVAQTYAEISPSGTGLKLFFYVAGEDVRSFLDQIGVLPNQWGCRRAAPGADGRDHGPAIEVYLSHRYFAVTGQRWPGSPAIIALLQRETLDRIAQLVPPPRSSQSHSRSGTGDNSRSAKAFGIAARIKRAGGSFEEMLTALLADPDTATWVHEKGEANSRRELHRLWERPAEGPSLADFHAYMPGHNYIFVPTCETWPASSVNARIPPQVTPSGREIKASAWLDQNRPVEQMTWAPGMSMIIPDRLICEGGWIERKGVRCFNLYRPPSILRGDPHGAQRWLDHVRRVFPSDALHVINFLAHRVQRPWEKINHALVLGGCQGIGKDTLLEPVKLAIGPWNFSEVSPTQVMGRFNGFLKAVILRISEARDLGEFDRFRFYDHMKAYIASPPDVLRVDEKHLREHNILNVCGVILTTNHKTDGIYLPADDRRHYVAWSDLTKEDFTPDYWRGIYAWYDQQGARNVAAYLAALDISEFDCKAPPPKTPAFWEIVDASRAPENAELVDALDQIDTRDTITLQQVIAAAEPNFAEWLRDRRNSRKVPHRMEECGYVAVRNNGADDGLWKVDGKRQVIYARVGLTPRDRYRLARERSERRSV